MQRLGDTIAAIKWRPAASVREVDAVAARSHLSEMLVRTGENDRQAFRDLYVLTSGKLFSICVRICGEQQAAEDVLHDVYLTIWKRAGAFEPERASPISWLATIARNRSIDWLRAKKVRTTVPLDHAFAVADPAVNAEAILLTSDAFRRLHICLDELSERQRTAIYAAFFGDMTYAALAEQQGVPVSTMKSLIRRTLLQLKTVLDDS